MKKDYSIEIVDESNMFQAAVVHSVSWKASHRSFCSEDFIEMHSPEHQLSYIRKKMDAGSTFYLMNAKN